ncbi:putative Ig domain-containing protein [Candidatus Magnetaquicoccus inordinatus]|uniref:putative Ig domain-containing protein n=1 Tax=Candidatus Magnetaquicoccus inordinatus TaxID=2496818 RepID=UPI001D0F1B89|nr:putative Ig domain-containing protein [Candidatus Magnetaquicoccus inordinatus]
MTQTLDVAVTGDGIHTNSVAQLGSSSTPALFVESGQAVILNASLSVHDPELDSADNYAGATLTLHRLGGSNAYDHFSAPALSLLSELSEGSDLVYNTIHMGTVTHNSGGELSLTFNNNASTLLVNTVLSMLQYSNSEVQPASQTIQIEAIFNDGNSGLQGQGGAKVANTLLDVAVSALPSNLAGQFTSTVGTLSSVNIALGKEVTGAALDPVFAASKIVDGSITEENCPSDYWLTAGPSGSATINLGQLHAIGKIEFLDTHNSFYNDFTTKDWTLEILDAAQSVVYTAQGTQSQLILSAGSTLPVNTITIPDVSGQYVRFNVINSWGVGGGLNELRVFEINQDSVYVENGSAVTLDSSLTIHDPELDAANSYAGSTVTIHRQGGANAYDHFVAPAPSALYDLIEGGVLLYNGTTLGTVTHNSGGELVLSFNGNATTSLVNTVLSIIQYSNSEVDPLQQNVLLDVIFNDGNSGAQGHGGAQSVTHTISVAVTGDGIQQLNHAPVVDNVVADQTAIFGQNFNFVVPGNSFSDSDSADTLTYSATLQDGSALPSWLAFNASTHTFSGSVPVDAENVAIKVRVTDTHGAYAEDSFALNILMQGVLLDSPVQGIEYQTATQTGITGTGGSFSYATGETVTFSLGNIVLGSVVAGEVVTPLNLTDGNMTAAGNILRLLQTLDSDQNPDNGITISQATLDLANAISGSVNLADSDLFSNVLLTDLLSGLTPVSESAAWSHFRSNSWVDVLRAASMNGGSEAESVTVDSTGGIYVTGSFWGSVDLNPGDAVQATITTHNGSDAFLQKFDASGQLQWAKTLQVLGSGHVDAGEAVIVEEGGHDVLYTFGQFSGTLDLNGNGLVDAGDLTSSLSGGHPGNDLYIIKRDITTGNVVWGSVVGDARNQDGGLFVADAQQGSGSLLGTSQWVNSDGSIGHELFLHSLTLADGLTASSDDTIAWSLADEINTAKMVAGHLYLGGESALSLNPGQGYVANIDLSTGSESWRANFEGQSGVSDLAMDADGHLYVVGSFVGSLTFNVGTANVLTLQAGGTGHRLYAAQIDSTGEVVWAHGVGLGASGYEVGEEFSMTLVDNTLQIAGGYKTATMADNALLVSLSLQDGHLLNETKFGGNDNEQIQDLVSDAHGNLLLVGQVGEDNDFSTLTGDAHGIATGTSDSAFILKMNGATGHIINTLGSHIAIHGIPALGHTLTAEISLQDLGVAESVAYQWQHSTDGSTWNDLSGSTSQTVEYKPTTAGEYLRLQVTVGSQAPIYSEPTLAVAAINHPPEVQDFVRVGNQGEAITFSLQDFASRAIDPDWMSGNTDPLAKIRITALPDADAGQLLLNGNLFSVGQEILLADLDNLVFVPQGSFHAATHFSWQASDGEGWSTASALTTLVLTQTPSSADAVGFARMQTLADSSSGSKGNAVVVDAAGNIFVAGTFHGSVEMGSDTLTSVGDSAFVQVYSAAGVSLGALPIENAGGSIQVHNMRVVTETVSGVSHEYLYVAGNFTGTLNPNESNSELILTSEGTDLFVEKLEVTGTGLLPVWAQNLGGMGDQDGRIVRADNTGVIIGWGDQSGTAGGTSGSLAHLIKYNADGTLNFSEQTITDGAANDTINALTMDRADTNIVMVGTHQQTVQGQTQLVPFVDKISLSGGHWYQLLDDVVHNSTSNATATAVSVDKANNIYVSGISQNGSYSNIYISKLDGSGDQKWQTQTGSGATAFSDRVSSAMDNDGNLYVAGSFTGMADFGEVLTSSSSNASDIFVVKLDYAGTVQWARALGGDGADKVGGLTVDSAGAIYVTGQASGVADLDPGLGTVQQDGAVGEYSYLVKLNSAGLLDRLPQGGVSISGSAMVGQQLSANTSTLSDADNISAPTYSYQWQFQDSLGWADINGATSSTFTLNTSELGRVIRVVTSFVDGHGVTESVASNATASIAPTPVYQPPVLNGLDASVHTTLNGAAVTLSPSLTVADSDSSQLSSATISISSGWDSGDLLAVDSPGSLTASYNSSSGLLTLSGAATLAEYQSALRSVTFQSADLTGTHTLAWSLTDSSGTISTPLFMSVVVDAPPPSNQPPVLTAFTLPSSSVNPATVATFSFADLTSLSNASDSDSNDSVSAFVVKQVSSGTLLIGISQMDAEPWSQGSNDVIDANHIAFWSSDSAANGQVSAFTVVARDTHNAESTTPVAFAVNVMLPDSVGDSVNTASSLPMDSFVDGLINTDGDHDFYAVSLQANNSYRFQLLGVQNGVRTLADPVLALWSYSGGTPTMLASNDDFNNLPDSQLDFIPSLTGTYYLDAANLNAINTGGYRLSAVVMDHAPVLEIPVTSVNYSVNSSAVILAPALTVIDLDGDMISSATVQFTSGLQSGDALTWASSLPAGITASYNTTYGTLTLTGDASVADYQDALRTVGFQGTAPGSHTFDWSVAGITALSSRWISTSLEAVVDNRPTLSAFSPFSGSVPAGTAFNVSFSSLLNNGDEASANSTVNAFVVDSVTSGTLLIGYSFATATPWAAGSNDVIDAIHDAFWISPDSADGSTNAFNVVARDGNSLESATPIAVPLYVVPTAEVGSSTGTAGLIVPSATLNDTVTISGIIDSDTDHDWYAITLHSGVRYQFALHGVGTGSNSLPDPYLRLGSSDPMMGFMSVASNDNLDGNTTDAIFTYFSTQDRKLYLDASASTASTPVGGTYTLSVTPIEIVNAAPVVSSSTSYVNYSEGGAPVLLNSGFTLSDSDSTQLSMANVSIKGYIPNSQGLDQLSFAPGNGYDNAGTWNVDHSELTFSNISGTNINGVWNSQYGFLSLSGTASLADYQDVLRSVLYASGDATTTADRVVQIGVMDVGQSTSNVASSTFPMAVVHTTGSDDAASLSNSGVPAVYTQANEPAVVLAPQLAITDLDSSTISGATVRISSNLHSGDVLEASALIAGITQSYDVVNGILSLSGTASLADYQGVLRSVTFGSVTIAQHQIEWIVNSGGLSSNTLTTTVDLISSVALSSLDGSSGFRLHDPPPPYTSTIVSSAGDFNGDGFADIIVGTPYANSYYGGAFLLFGSASGVGGSSLALSNLGTHGLELTSVFSLNANLGYSVSSAGDLNGDGLADLVVGADRMEFNGYSNSGTAYVVFGTSSTASIDLDALNGNNGFFVEGFAAGMELGHAVQSAGDVNGDGFADLLVAAPGSDRDVMTDQSGSVYIVFGKSGGFASSIDLSNPDGNTLFRLDGYIAEDKVGFSVAAAGDVNGDGFADVLVGSQSGASYLLFGKGEAFSATLDVSGLDGNTGFRMDGGAYHAAGFSVSSAGDFNGDGFADLLIGAPSLPNSGANDFAYVVFGKSGGFAATLELTSLTASDGFRLTVGNTVDDFGIAVSKIGDFNGDGYDDILVSADSADPNGVTSAGSSFVLFGHGTNSATGITLTSLAPAAGFRLDGSIANDQSGYSVSGAGDVNGDGFADLLVGTFGSGNSYVLYGHANSGSSVLVGDVYTPTNNVDEQFIGGSTSSTEQHIETGGGADVVHAGAGNDTIKVADMNFRLIDGGAGIDQLQLDLSGSVHHTIDLAELSGRVQGIEKIHLWNGESTLIISAVDVCNLSDSSNILTVDGNIGQVELVGLWNASGSYSGDFGVNYNVYTSGAAVLRVVDTMQVHYAVQQVDFTTNSIFNADVVGQSSEVQQVNGQPAIVNANSDSFDGASSVYITNAVAYDHMLDGGLADDGYYAANADHPVVLLKANNSYFGDNALQVTETQTATQAHSVNLNVQDGVYDVLHVFAAAGNLVSNTVTNFHVVLHYADGSTETSASAALLDWFETSTAPDVYTLISGMNRGDGSAVNAGVGAAVFGYTFAVDATKELSSFDLVTEDVDSNATVNYMGATLSYQSVARASDHSGPTLMSYTAEQSGTEVILTSNITLHFNESLAALSGGTVVFSDGVHADVTISLTDSSQVTIQGSDIIINPTDNLLSNKIYIVTMDGASLSDLQGNRFAGINPEVVMFNTVNSGGDPLVLDLDGNGVTLQAIADNTRFDMNADGLADRAGWFSQGDGVLVVDVNGNGRIDGIQEMISEHFTSNVSSSLSALATLDANGDGRIDVNDAAFGQLQVWIDVNQDAVSATAELHTLQELGVAALDLNLDREAGRIDHGNRITGMAAVEFADGHNAQMAEVEFSFVDEADVASIEQVTHALVNHEGDNWESDALAELVSRALAARDGMGASHVVFGHASNFDSPLDIPSLDGKSGFRLYAADSIVAAAGDHLGEAHGDMLLGSGASDEQVQQLLFGHDNGFASMLDAAGLDALHTFRHEATTMQALPDMLGGQSEEWVTGGSVQQQFDSYPSAALALSHLATLDGQQSGLELGNNLLLPQQQGFDSLHATVHDALNDFNPLALPSGTPADSVSHNDAAVAQGEQGPAQESTAWQLLDDGVILDTSHLLAQAAQNGQQAQYSASSVNVADLLDFSGNNHPFLAQGEIGDTIHLQNAMDSLLASNGTVLLGNDSTAVDSMSQSSVAAESYVLQHAVDTLQPLLVGSEIVFNFSR